MERLPLDKFDSFRLGAWVGFLLPVAALAVILCVMAQQKGMTQLEYYLLSPGVASRVLCLATLSNAVVFFIATRTNRLRSARGILALTIVYAIVVFILALTL